MATAIDSPSGAQLGAQGVELGAHAVHHFYGGGKFGTTQVEALEQGGVQFTLFDHGLGRFDIFLVGCQDFVAARF